MTSEPPLATDTDDLTDADEMTTFDGSTISLSLSPLMTPAKTGTGKCYDAIVWLLIVLSLLTCIHMRMSAYALSGEQGKELPSVSFFF